MSNVLDPIYIPEARPRGSEATKPHLRRVSRPARRGPAVPVLVGGGVVILAFFLIAVMHAFMIGGQRNLDAMQREVASETESIATLRLRVAELEAPDRVLSVAEDRLGMVEPTEVGYLPPLGTDVDAVNVRVAAATLAPVETDDVDSADDDATATVDDAPDADVDDTVSPEQAEVDAGGPATADAAGDMSAADADANSEVDGFDGGTTSDGSGE